MDRILPSKTQHPLYGVKASRAIEAEAAAAIQDNAGEPRLMVRAGIAVARLCAALAPFAERVWIAAGPGNNGGDGIEAAIHLQAQGRKVTLTLVGDSASLPGDAAASLREAQAAGLVIEPAARHPPRLRSHDIAIDALLGIGGSRPPTGPIAETIQQLNRQPCRLLAIDVPSGLDSDTGRLHGEFAVQATHTLALLTLKPGLFTGHGRDHAGDVWLDKLGIAAPTIEPDAWLTGSGEVDFEHPRRHAEHKGSFGDVVVVGGAPGMSGAALLCARAAHAAGAGRVWLVPLDQSADLLDPQRPELMWRRSLASFETQTLATQTVVCGCGGGSAVAQALPRLLQHAARLVIDADALNAIALQASLARLLCERAERGQQSVLTPHPLEAARLLSLSVAEVQHDRLRAARALAEQFGAVVILKGSGSIVAAPAQIPHINASGNAALATAGSGDVLAGWLAGSWSASAGRGRAPGPANAAASGLAAMQTAVRVAHRAVWWHGAAAEASGLTLLRASDLIEHMAAKPQR